MSTESENVHGTGLVVDGKGILLRGPSGAGKSLLALELLEDCALRGVPGFLIADDRIDITRDADGLVMSAPDAIAGLIELRGRGIVTRPHQQSGRLHLVVDVIGELVRMVEEEDMVTELAGVTLARCPIPERQLTDGPHQRLLVWEALRAVDTGTI